MPFVCHSYVLACHPYVTRMYSYVIRMYSYVIRMSFIILMSLVPTRKVIRMWLECGFTMNLEISVNILIVKIKISLIIPNTI